MPILNKDYFLGGYIMSKFDSGCPIAPKLAYRINLWENNSNTGTECLLFTQDFDKFCTGVLEVIDTYSLTPQQCSIKVNPYGVFFSCCIKKSENTPVFEDWSFYLAVYDLIIDFSKRIVI